MLHFVWYGNSQDPAALGATAADPNLITGRCPGTGLPPGAPAFEEPVRQAAVRQAEVPDIPGQKALCHCCLEEVSVWQLYSKHGKNSGWPVICHLDIFKEPKQRLLPGADAGPLGSQQGCALAVVLSGTPTMCPTKLWIQGTTDTWPSLHVV